jgi:hypothetical protein
MLRILEPLPLSSDDQSVIRRLQACFNDREAHIQLPMAIARFRDDAVKAIYGEAQRLDDVRTVTIEEGWLGGAPDRMAAFARLYHDDVDELMCTLIPSARFRKGHYSYGRFTVPQPHGLHTDHSLEDPGCAGEPICIARIETLGTHYLTGDYRKYDARTQSMMKALRYWIAVPEGEPEDVFDELLANGTLKSIPVNHVMLMVAGNSSTHTQVTQHIAARPPGDGVYSAFFQRQYRLEVGHASAQGSKHQ